MQQFLIRHDRQRIIARPAPEKPAMHILRLHFDLLLFLFACTTAPAHFLLTVLNHPTGLTDTNPTYPPGFRAVGAGASMGSPIHGADSPNLD